MIQVVVSAYMTPESVMLLAMTRRARQLDLDLRAVSRWGGRREGAGRKPGPTPRIPRRTREAFPACHPCHVTVKIRRGIPSLRTVKCVRELEPSLAAACERGRFRVAQYSIQPDHVHLIVEAPGRHALADVLLDARRHLAKWGRVITGAAIDPDSSGRWFDDWKQGPVDLRDPPSVAAPHTWLLAIGWRRHGLIDPSEIPGPS